MQLLNYSKGCAVCSYQSLVGVLKTFIYFTNNGVSCKGKNRQEGKYEIFGKKMCCFSCAFSICKYLNLQKKKCPYSMSVCNILLLICKC